jgi:hypothetical protein
VSATALAGSAHYGRIGGDSHLLDSGRTSVDARAYMKRGEIETREAGARFG